MNKTLIIAEAGVNHNGDIRIAEKMIEVAYHAGADIIKFQTSNPEMVYSKFAKKADYQKRNTDSNESAIEMSRKFHLEPDDFVKLKNKCDDLGICFLSTPFDLKSIDFLSTMDMPYWKIPSGEITNLPYLIKIARTGKPIIMSTGMSTLKEVKESLDILQKNGSGEVILLHCTTEYPAPFSEVNLRAMNTLHKMFGAVVGYSDHTPGIEVPIAAVAMGAKVIEKHFTLDRNMKGPDHKASLEPDELRSMIQSIRHIEKAFGNGNKVPTEAERKNIAVARKSIVAATYIKKGDMFTENNITTKRPGTGVSPMNWFEVVGTKAIRDFEEDELIEL